jgi:translocation and assembly module TamB
MRAWDTVWGDGGGDIVVENSYVTVKNGIIRHDGSELRASGRFSLGYPRRDGGEEIDAVFQVTNRDVDGLRHAFEIDDYPLSGRLSGEFHLTGEYQHPLGFGSMRIERGSAWHEPFDTGTASLRFDGQGVRLDGVTMTKGAGRMTGAAYVSWDSTYSFNADARGIPMDEIAAFDYPSIKPSGRVDFTAGGSGTFDAPRYDVNFNIHDMSVVDEPVGVVTGTLAMRGAELSGTVDASSPRLSITGTGRIAMTAKADADLTFVVHNTSLDPYVRLFVPKLSEYATAVTTGSIRVSGELADFEHLHVEGTVDSLDMQLFDYAVRNAGPVRLALEQNVVRIEQLELVGDGTRLRVDGTVGLQDRQMAIRANGDADLRVLQSFEPDIRGSGRAELTASVNGPIADPQFFGSATITNGSVRYSALPNALDAINGVLRFDSRSIRLDDLTARMGGGLVQFGGIVGLEGYVPGDLNVIVRGENVNLRVPQGVRSTVDAELFVHGNIQAPTLAGTVQVKNAIWNRDIDPSGGILKFGGDEVAAVAAGAVPSTLAPVRLDVHLLIPSTLRIENNLMRLVANADLQLRGTTERPAIFGRAEVERGDVEFEGRRYLVTNGSVDFTNPNRIEPFFDFEAETRVRIPGQTYRVTIRSPREHRQA